jgi:calmodulin
MQMIGETVTDTQLNDMLALADLDKDGRINYEG